MSTIRIRWREGAPSHAVFHIPSALLVEGPQGHPTELRPGDVATVLDAPLWRQELRPSDGPGLELEPDPTPAPELEQPEPAIEPTPALEPDPVLAALAQPEPEPEPVIEPTPTPAPVR
jgi:hypothetical protein